jgi:integrase
MPLSRALKRAGGPGPTAHGFRSTFRDWTAEATATPREVAEQALAHSVGSAVERAYARSDLFEKRRALMAAWADYLGRPPAEVIPIRAVSA